MPQTKLDKLQKDINLISQCLEERWIPARDGIVAFSLTSCALCKEYTRDDCYDADNKNKCPIAEKTSQRSCRGTPYYRCIDSYANILLVTKLQLPLLQPEIEFLRNLLKELKTKYNDEHDEHTSYNNYDE